jgi:hypothetical protein
MRRTISMRCMIASDAACIVGGFVAAVLVVYLLQNMNAVGRLPETSVQWQETPTVNRAGKSDRVRLSFEDRFGREFWIAREEPSSGSGDSAALPGRTPPAGNTTIVPKGLVISGEPAKAINAPTREVPGTPKPAPSPVKAVGCEPLASPLVEPELARFAGRCLTELVARSKST